MLENRIKIKSIVQNQLPEYVKDEFPLVEEFLSQYYVSLEEKGNASNIIQNIDQYVKIDYLANLIQNTFLTSDVSIVSGTITVDSTYGFPETNGIILIDDEIILYKSKTENEFLQCVRGFSGITSYKNINTDELIFKSTSASSHSYQINADERRPVVNLSVLFLIEFFNKLKSQITPGFESNEFYEDLNEKLFLKQSINFYQSKGTQESFRILFGALYGVNAKVILPRDYLFQPSDAQYRITEDLVVESIDGNPEELINGTLYQDENENFSAARGTISEVEKIIRGENIYYRISLDSGYDKDIDVFGSIKSKFKIHPKTKITSDISSGSSYIDVDSTIGFPDSGTLIVDLITTVNFTDLITTIQINYTSKVANQFLGCTGITLDLPRGYDIKVSDYCYGFNRNNEIVKLRVTGVNVNIDIPENTKYYNSGDLLKIKTLGEDSKRFKDNNWIFNISTKYKVKSYEKISNNSLRIVFFDNHTFNIGNELEVITPNGTQPGILISVENNKTIIVRTDANQIVYEIRKKISKFNTDNPEYNIYNTNVQNTYVDYSGNTYVTSPSLPSYLDGTIKINDFSYQFPSNSLDISETQSIEIPNHQYYTGDSIIFSSGDKDVLFDNNLIDKFLVYIKKVDNNTIKLSNSRENIFKEKYINIIGNLSNSKIYPVKFADENSNLLNISPQRVFKKFSTPVNFSGGENRETIPGFTGIFVNGVELLNYKSLEQVFYGSIESIDITAEGNNYNVINPPNLQILDPSGENAEAYLSVKGSLERIDIVNPGFDYIDDPVITISGGNGTGAQAIPRMGYFEHFSEFNAAQVISNNTIEFYEDHNFINGEKVSYIADNGTAIPDISIDTFYYVAIEDSKRIKLYKTAVDASTFTNEVQISSSGVGVHKFKSFNKKKRISSVQIISPGENYSSKKTFVSSTNFASDTLIIKNHNYSDKDLILYSPTQSNIVGLTSGTSYYVTKINDNEIKLSNIGPDDDKLKNYKERKYINIGSLGSGEHYFDYLPIQIRIDGRVSIASTNLPAELRPIFRGSIDSVFLKNGGVGYGSSEIINLNRQPTMLVSGGSGAQITPVIVDGKIEDIIIQSPGLNYDSLPDLIIKGDGIGAVLTPVFSNGSISEVKIISKGTGYTKENTRISVEYSGLGSKFFANIKSWRINLFEKLYNVQNDATSIFFDDGVLTKGYTGLQYSNLYAPRELRKLVYNNNYISDLVIRNGKESLVSSTHSPIIGWAYDGNPIYGPFGYSSITSGTIKSIKSSYQKIKKVPSDRPPTSLYPIGFFIEDYVYTGSGDLDESNGRFCITPEFPNGTYAYFCTFEDFIQRSTDKVFKNYRLPSFPYVIGDIYKNKPIDFNFNQTTFLNEKYINDNKLLRNTTPYKLNNDNSEYEYLFNPNKIKEQNIILNSTNSGAVDSIKIINSGENYKVHDSVIFDDGSVGGEVSNILGKNISTITSSTKISNFQFVPYKNRYIGVSTIPHQFFDNTYATLSSSYEYKKYGKIKILGDELVLQNNVDDSSSGIVSTFKLYGNNLNFPLTNNDFYKVNDEIIKILNINTSNSTIEVLRKQFNTVGYAHSSGDILEPLSRKVLIDIGKNINTYNKKLNTETYFNPSLSVGIGTSYGVGITSTLFLSEYNNNTQVSLGKSTYTKVYFDNLSDISYYKNGGYVKIFDSSNTNWNSYRTKIVSIGSTIITLDFDSTLLPGNYISAFMNKWDIVDIPTKSLRIVEHGFNTGDSLSYNPNDGDRIEVSINGQVSFELQSNVNYYAVKISDDLIGISTIVTDSILDSLYFTGIGTNVYHSLTTNYDNIFTGNLSQHQISVETETPHQLEINDLINLNIVDSTQKIFKVIFDPSTRRFSINPKNIEGVNLDTDEIILYDHNLKTGDKVIYKKITSEIGGLTNNGIYYAIIVDENRIKLGEYFYDATKNNPNYIKLSSLGDGKLLPINPRIEILKYQDIVFDVSDSSLSFGNNSSFDIKFYSDELFNNEYLTANIIKTGRVGIDTTSTVVLKTQGISDTIYYTLVPEYSNLISLDQRNIFIDYEQNENNKIILKDSVLSNLQQVVGGSTTTFVFNVVEPPEYTDLSSGQFLLEYTTNSIYPSGPISAIALKNKNKTYKKLPYITEVKTTNGVNSILETESFTIGKISNDNITIKDYGFNYSIDSTVRPKYKFPDILRVSPYFVFDRIEILSNGKNYISPPNLVAIDAVTKRLIDDAVLYYDFGNSNVVILQNTKGISKFEPTILPVDNDNGISIFFIEHDPLTNDVTVTIDAEYSEESDFPFSIGDLVIIENVIVEEGGKGYNSDIYDYQPFVVNYIDPNIGGANGSIRYNLNDYLSGDEYPGIYDNRIVTGKIIPQKYFPTFKTYLKSIEFLDNEIVKSTSNSGNVVGWDSNNNILKVSTRGQFNVGDTITGQSSSIKADIVDIFSLENYIDIGSNITFESGFKKETGFLNNDRQRLHDNDYYQYFSYSVESEIDFSYWADDVDRLNHTSGFKKFSDLNIQSEVNTGMSKSQDLGNFYSDSLSPEVIELTCYHDFDLASENSFLISTKLKSNEIYFNSRIISDYIESVGNRVLLIDDISDKFTTQEILPYEIVDEMDVRDIRYKKYFIYVSDVLDPSRTEFSVVSLLNDKVDGYINNYAIISSEDVLGYYDYIINDGITGQLIYYPSIVDRKIYNFNVFSLDIGDVVGIASTSIQIGDIASIEYSSYSKLENSLDTISVVGLTTNKKIGSKYLITISDQLNSYYEFYEVNALNDDIQSQLAIYGDLSNNNDSYDVETKLVTIDSSIIDGNLVLDIIPTQVSIGSSFDINVVSASIGSTETTESFVEVNGNVLETIFVSVPITNPFPEKTLIHEDLNDFKSSYNIISITDLTNNKVEFLELCTLLNNVNQESFVVEYGNLYSGNITMGIFETEINDLTGSIGIYYTPYENISYEIRILKLTIGTVTQTGVRII
jgi:hypothetical protein